MEEKTYPVQGTVTISVEEYRDLLVSKFEAEHDLSDTRSRAWKAESEVDKLKERIKELDLDNRIYKEFISSNPELAVKFFTYRNASKNSTESM